MEIALEILKYILPAIIVFIGVYFILQNFMENEHKRLQASTRMNNQRLVTPVRLQAYERITLFLERISLNNLIMRTYKTGMSARMLHAELLKTIRTEYEHNLAQQIYIEPHTWRVVKTAKEEVIKVINSSAGQLPEDATGMEMSKFLLEIVGKVEKTPTEVAIGALKREVSTIF